MDFLQSKEWRKFQESVGRKTFLIDSNEIYASIIEHKLPIVGKYFYIPRGPEKFSDEILKLAKENKAGWIRFDPVNEEILNKIKTWTLDVQVRKAPHDMQPREIFVINITKSEEELLANMKSKTRYNIKLAQKHGIKISNDKNKEHIDEFLRLVKIMAKRQGIAVHPDEYYRKMVENIPTENLKLYAAEYDGKIIAAIIAVFYNKTAAYLHGASDDKYKNLMAPYLLQWQAIKDAKAAGCEKYDFGGIKTGGNNSWAGITKFKLGFSPNTKLIEFPGSYDIIVNPIKYSAYRIIQKIKSFIQ